MVRFYVLIFTSLHIVISFIIRANYYADHPEKYDEFQCFGLVRHIIALLKKRGRISTDVYGLDNLPGEGGYVMFSNHQGRYDALGIMSAHPTPCAVVMDSERSTLPMANEVIRLVRGKRLNKADLRQQVKVMQEVAEEIKEGRRYLLFPEGGYTDNHNEMQFFHPGTFKCAQRAKCPIVPVAIWDSYKAFEGKSLRRVRTQVHFLDAISFEEYEGWSTAQIRDLVVKKIEERMHEIAENGGKYPPADNRVGLAD